MSRSLHVFINNEQVGTIYEENAIWGFAYTETWLSHSDAFALSLAIPLESGIKWDGATTRPVQWFFDNLLPEENARVLLAKDEKVDAGDIFSLLLAIGAESAGALTLLSPGEMLPLGAAHPLTAEELNQRIEALPKTPLNDKNRKRMSLAGAQHKMLVIYRDHALAEPSGQWPSTHILKPEHSQPASYPFTCRNEWFVMKLASLCKLNVPEVDVLYVPQAAYVVERFDRTGTYPDLRRLHILDGCQLLNIPPADKYKASHVESLAKMVERCRAKALTQLILFRWALFNALVGNGDAHMKNLSFRFERGQVAIMPHYDLLSTVIYEERGQHLNAELSQPMGAARTFADLRLQDLLAFAAGLGIKATLAEREIKTMTGLITKGATALIQQVEALPVYPGKAGELRMLRQIEHLAIHEMIRKIS